jgi:hypothetical protein
MTVPRERRRKKSTLTALNQALASQVLAFPALKTSRNAQT